jgi:hypothetical protein
MTLGRQYDEALYLIQGHNARITCNLQVRLLCLIQEDADVICHLIFRELDKIQYSTRLENINNTQVETGLLYTRG